MLRSIFVQSKAWKLLPLEDGTLGMLFFIMTWEKVKFMEMNTGLKRDSSIRDGLPNPIIF